MIHDSCRVAHLIKENKKQEKKDAAERIQIKKKEKNTETARSQVLYKKRIYFEQVGQC